MPEQCQGQTGLWSWEQCQGQTGLWSWEQCHSGHMVCEEGFGVVWVGGSSDSTLPLAVIGTAWDKRQPS